MQLRIENVRDRINQFYGLLVVKRIRFDISHELELLDNGKKNNKMKKEVREEVIEKVGSNKQEKFDINASDPELRELLQSLQRNWFYRRKKWNKEV